MTRSGMVTFHQALEPFLVDIDTLHMHPDNYNNGDVDEVMNSITVSGMYRPVYVQRSTNRIVAGNTTWAACKELGAEQIPAVFLDIDDTTARRIVVGDNEIARRARPDNGMLLNLLEYLHDTDSLLGTGVSETQLRKLRTLVETPIDFNDDAKHRTWPSLCFQVPPQTKAAFLAMTDAAGGDRERFELLLRLAGWEGAKR